MEAKLKRSRDGSQAEFSHRAIAFSATPLQSDHSLVG